jgi:Asp-tRNA(Asn)/Glu-tRNA(Gln) amidotransferase C subunit
MEELVRKLNAEYGFDLSEEEIQLVARQAEAAERLMKRLYEVDVSHVMPLATIERRRIGDERA